jgi:hypothetical protein
MKKLSSVCLALLPLHTFRAYAVFPENGFSNQLFLLSLW